VRCPLSCALLPTPILTRLFSLWLSDLGSKSTPSLWARLPPRNGAQKPISAVVHGEACDT